MRQKDVFTGNLDATPAEGLRDGVRTQRGARRRQSRGFKPRRFLHTGPFTIKTLWVLSAALMVAVVVTN